MHSGLRCHLGQCATLLLVTVGGPSVAFSRTLYVPAQYPTIVQAMGAAAPGDVIEVACGVYFEHSISMKSGVTLRSATGAPACVTVDAGGLGRVILCNAVDASTRIEGLTLRGGHVAGYDPYSRGAGILCAAGAAPQIVACVFESNVADFGYGGGMACVNASPSLSGCVFRANEVQGDEAGNFGVGGAVACENSSPSFVECTFEKNRAYDDGGALYGRESLFALRFCLFTRNWAGGDGGGLACRRGDAIIEDCVFNDNVAESSGGAMRIRPFASPVIRRCVLTGNRAPGGGGAMDIGSESSPLITDVLFQDNEASYGGGVGVVDSSSPHLERCVFIGDSAYVAGGAAYCSRGGAPVFANCTFALNGAGVRGGAITSSDSEALFERCIIAFQTAETVIDCTGTVELFPRFTCCNVFGNAGGDWEISCVAEQAMVDGNFSADPLFCGLEDGILLLDGMSPCLPGQHPRGDDCGLIGARDRGCGVTAAAPVTWGTLKAEFREP